MYAVGITRAAQKGIDHLQSTDRRRVLAAIYALAQNPRPSGCKKLVGSPYWRIRVGNYRVVYDIKDTELLVTVIDAGHRSDIYR